MTDTKVLREAPTVIAMVQAHLKANGFDGLYSDDGECACLTDDLAPCGEIGGSCSAGYKQRCDCGDHDFHVGSER